ncbi:MAG: hypothetical protein QNK89_04495 [Lacinutrix sp.]|uniref:hypothetical protein n=1 Tax=Lacinutrix sp. TaxID=1937692 RepID=UPI0030A90E4D
MKEFCIKATTQLHSTNGVVHIQAIGYNPEDGYTEIEWDARELLNDIPSLYRMAKQAVEQEDKYLKDKYKQFKKIL